MIDLHCLHPACGKPIQVDPSTGSILVECQECRSEFIVIKEKGDFRLRPSGTTTMTAGALQQSRGAPGPSEFPQANVQPAESVSRLLSEKKSALAQYEIQKQVAQGGMGAVFQCLDKGFNRPVAMKVMLPEVAARELNAIRFLNEAQITGQMEHPNIVPVHELGMDEEGATFFTMKLVQGKTLNDVIKDNRSSWEGNADAESVSLPGLLNSLLKACDAIAFAHSRGVIHRDLKPQNIMIGEFGEVLVMDWGLAKVIRGPEGEQQASPSDQLLLTLNLEDVSNQSTVMANPEESPPSGSATMEGTVAGTPSYMPPEQARGLISELDERSDIYSLGAILYEMLTLEKPVLGQTRTEILMRTAEGRIVPPVERRKDRDISTELSAIAMKAMAGKKEDRYPTVKAFSRDIQLYLEGRTVSAKEDSFLEASLKLMRRNRGVSGMAFIAAASIAILSAWFILHLRVERDLARDSAIEADRLRVRADTEHRHQMEHASKASEALARQAMRAADQGRLGEAEARADTTIKMFPIGPWGHYALAYIMRLKGNNQSAREHLENALEIDRDHVESQALEASLSDDEGALSHALDLVSGAKSSTDWRALRESGIVLHKAKKFDKAAQLFERALSLMRAGKSLPKPATIADVQYRMDRSIVEFRCLGFHESIKLLPEQEQRERTIQLLMQIHPGLTRKMIKTGRDIRQWQFVNSVSLKWLQPFRGLSIEHLHLVPKNDELVDIEPLRGLPLKYLKMSYHRVTDLSPLQGMPLEFLGLMGSTRITTLAPLRGLQLRSLELGNAEVSDLSPLEGMPITKLNLHYVDFDPRTFPSLPLTELKIREARKVRNLEFLRNCRLKILVLEHVELASIDALKGMPLEELNLTVSGLSDLSPLKGMRLVRLKIGQANVKDLTPIAGMPLRMLDLSIAGKVDDLRPLRGMQIETLNLQYTSVRDLEPISGLPLKNFAPPREDQLTEESRKILEELKQKGVRIFQR